MNEKNLILFSAMLKPEWIDFTIQNFIQINESKRLNDKLNEYLKDQISSTITLQKTVSQLQRTAGFLSPLSKKDFMKIYNEMVQISPDKRIKHRLILLFESSEFIKDVILSINKLCLLGVNGIRANQIYEYVTAKYGERAGLIPRRIRYVLQTLSNLMIIENKNRKWYVIRPELLEEIVEKDYSLM
ncbi:hypothetical protein SAMN05444673_4220 [Bacillus sp. OV166]|uniref:hypothetical protein n=1 Tax=Bacillus sp. OV166 TaxID=1882763 RepID=UPI000A2AE50C|nr:hypothetical protein [Bacillus sp. OV166]SMQ81264.1 hypothetical protein SAMN05444673_4220 [Bacillus sp. OV166]